MKKRSAFFLSLFATLAFGKAAWAQPRNEKAHAFNTGKALNGYTYVCWMRVPDTAYLFARIPAGGNGAAPIRSALMLPEGSGERMVLAYPGKRGMALTNALTGDTLGIAQPSQEPGDSTTMHITSTTGAAGTYIKALPQGPEAESLPYLQDMLDDTMWNRVATLSAPGLAMAALAGAYSLHDGGVDVGSSMLVLNADCTFTILGLGTLINGHWHLSPNGSIVCQEEAYPTPFLVSGAHRSDVAPGKTVIDCMGLTDADALIGFSTDSLPGDSLRRVFNDGTNCFGSDYDLPIPKGARYLQLACPVHDRMHMALGDSIYKGFVATFPLTDGYNTYTIQHSDRAATVPQQTFVVQPRQGSLYLNDREIGPRKSLNDEEQRMMAQLKANVDAATNGGPFVDDAGRTGGFYIRPAYKGRRTTAIRKLPPHFTAKCDEDE